MLIVEDESQMAERIRAAFRLELIASDIAIGGYALELLSNNDDNIAVLDRAITTARRTLGAEVQIETADTVVLGSWSLIRQLVMNLLHSAIVHNLLAGGFVRVEVCADGCDAILCLENSGDPLSDTQLATMTEPL